MEILLWLVPAGVVTLIAMLWAGWAGRERPVEASREDAVRHLERGLQSSRPVRYAAPTPARDRSTGLAVRPSRRTDTAVGGARSETLSQDGSTRPTG
ncbi:hypothetical protein [Nocardioides insulae]|uniref:hypothetical protein n=1 Tax=Nocardioides insulae TaxID=394734 RepID=UPI0004163997|nr:hypothetical protein [Nocardioides insulae]